MTWVPGEYTSSTSPFLKARQPAGVEKDLISFDGRNARMPVEGEDLAEEVFGNKLYGEVYRLYLCPFGAHVPILAGQKEGVPRAHLAEHLARFRVVDVERYLGEGERDLFIARPLDFRRACIEVGQNALDHSLNPVKLVEGFHDFGRRRIGGEVQGARVHDNNGAGAFQPGDELFGGQLIEMLFLIIGRIGQGQDEHPSLHFRRWVRERDRDGAHKTRGRKRGPLWGLGHRLAWRPLLS